MEMWEKSRVHSPRQINDRLILRFVVIFFRNMIKTDKTKHTIGLILLSLTALFWGAGFVLNDQLLDPTFERAPFYNMPALLLTFRFGIAALCLLAIFNKRIRFNKQILLYGGIGGLMLFSGFLLQTIGQKYTVPSHSGFFTASYVMFVPFITWIAYKKRPNWPSLVGVTIAIAGLVILNINVDEIGEKNVLIGDVITAACAIVFAFQIFWTDFTFKKNKVDHVQLTFWEITFAAILFVIYSAIFESKHYSTFADSFDVNFCWWRLAIVIFGGTTFAYYAQTFAQKNVPPTETSLVLSCESAIGAILAMILVEQVHWQTIVGGLLVIAAVILVEVVPTIQFKHKKRSCTDTCEQDGKAPDSNEQNTE